MKKEYSTIEEPIKNKRNIKEYAETLKLMDELKSVKKRWYFTKEEFLKMVMGESPTQRSTSSKILKKK